MMSKFPQSTSIDGHIRLKNGRHELLTLEEQLGLEFPEAYRQFLLEHDGFHTYAHPSIDGKEWRMATLVPTSGSVALNDVQHPNGIQTLFAQQLSVWADGIAGFSGTESTSITGSKERFSLDRLRNCVVIGDDNADLLVLDPGNQFSVWIYWHDGSDVQPISECFEKWLDESNPKRKRPSNSRTDPNLARLATRFVGEWRNEDDSMGVDVLRLGEDGVAERRFDDGSGGRGTWRLINELQIAFVIEDDGGAPEEEQFIVEQLDDHRMQLYDAENDYRDCWKRSVELAEPENALESPS